MMNGGPKICDPRVLAIQSHVVSGYVGNRCAVFPLQVHGMEVDFINSVQFSNHTGYKGGCKGQILTSSELWDLYDGLRDNNLANYTHLLTGYVAEESFLRRIRDIVIDQRKKNPEFFYICDPVLGDNGAYYVPKSLTKIYREVILGIADVITPNQFELQELSGLPVDNEENLLKAVDLFHSEGIKNVVVSSTDLGSPDTMFAYASNSKDRFRFEIPKLNAKFVGSGDVFTTLLLIWLYKTDHNLSKSLENVLSTLQAILRRTLSRAKDLCKDGLEPGAAELELRLIQSMEDLLHPQSLVKAVRI